MAKKILKRSLALGALMAFVITGSAMARTNGNIVIGDVAIDGVAKDVTITTDKPMTIGEDGKTLKITTASGEFRAVSDYQSNQGGITLIGSRIELLGIQRAAAAKDSSLIIGNEKTDSIYLKQTQFINENDIAIVGLANSKIELTAKNITIEADGTTAAHIMQATEEALDAPDYPTNHSTMTMTADTINIINNRVGGSGLASQSNGEMNIKGNLTVNATNAIDVRGNSITNINLDGKYTTKLNGDIVFETPNDPTDAQKSGKIINAYVNINFNGPESYWHGRSYQEYKVKVREDSYVYQQIVELQNDPYHGNLTGFKIAFNNGATWKVTDASCVNEVTFGDNANLIINGPDFTDKYAVTTNKLIMAPTANLVIKDFDPDTNYKVVKGENNISDSNLSYDRTALVAVENTDGVYEVEFKTIDKASAAELASAQNKAVAATGGDALAAPSIITGAIGPDAPAAAKELVSAITSSGASIDQKAAMVNAVAKIGEASGTTANAASVVNNVTSITTQRMSFTNLSTTPQGGHGKVERKYKSGAGVWAQYVHGKDKVEDMPSAGGANSYDSQYNGAVIGYDFKEVGKTHSGISFNYGEGDSHSKNSIASTRNDFDFWGVGAYTSIMNDDTNLIFDINYNKSDADVKQIVAGHEVTVNPNTTSLSVGVKAEKLIQNGPVQIVPYAGARFLTIDTDEYTSSAGTVYAPERQNIWLIPVGVSLRQENVYENGWKVTPKADLSYIWALGDTDSSMTVTTGAASDPIAYTVMDNGSFLGTLGIEAAKGDWTYGLSYSYQKGEYQRSDKWFVDVRYSF